MNLFEMRKLLFNLLKFYQSDNDKAFKNQLNSAYNRINDSVGIKLDDEVTSALKWTGKQLQMDIEIDDRSKQKIIKRKIKGLNIFERINNSKQRVLKDYRRTKKNNNKNLFSNYLGKEYRRLKRTIRTDTHRIKENTKDIAGRFADHQGIKYIKIWNCRFHNSREAHKEMHHQKADKYGYFSSPTGPKTRFPGGFGVAELDINCRCYVTYKKIGEIEKNGEDE